MVLLQLIFLNNEYRNLGHIDEEENFSAQTASNISPEGSTPRETIFMDTFPYTKLST